jgi:cell wall-associated NlpC family hydrolase
MSVRSKIANHAGVFVENGKMLHHFVGRLSAVEDYRALWRNSTVMVLRNKDVHVEPPKPQVADFAEFLPNVIRSKLAQAPLQSGPQKP